MRLRTMTKNRIVTVFDRYPEQTAQLKKLGDLFGKAGRLQLAQVNVSEIDRIQIDRGLDFIGDLDVRIKQSEATIRAMTKANGNVKLLKTIPGIGEFFARLIDAEIDDIGRFRNPKKLAPMPDWCRRPIPPAARPSTARSSSRATSGCAGLSSRRSPRPSPAMRSCGPNASI
ncbi:transposase [Rhizobium mongolense]